MNLKGNSFQSNTFTRNVKTWSLKNEVTISTLMMIDSLEMSDERREALQRNATSSEENKILITHGTDTMVETAISLAEKVKNKTVVLTGAMIPYKFGSLMDF